MTDKDNVSYIDDNIPHVVTELICIFCHCRFIGCRPEGLLLKTIECPGCEKLGGIIETGEFLDDEATYPDEIVEFVRKPLEPEEK